MTPIRMPVEGPFARSVREALESVASPDAAKRMIDDALIAARRTSIPEDTTPFALFYQGALRNVVRTSLGHGALEIVEERLAHVLKMAQSQVLQAARPRPVIAPPGPTMPPPATSRPPAAAPRPDGHELWEEDSAIRAVSSGALELAEETSRRRAESTTPTATKRADAPSRVLMLTLDPTLVLETEAELAGVCPIATVTSMQELLVAVSGADRRIVIVVDTALPSIDVPTVASLASAFPAGTSVVLWGMSDRQKQRLVTLFPVAASWITRVQGRSPADAILGR